MKWSGIEIEAVQKGTMQGVEKVDVLQGGLGMWVSGRCFGRCFNSLEGEKGGRRWEGFLRQTVCIRSDINKRALILTPMIDDKVKSKP